MKSLKSKKRNIQYFPFCPGIGWNVTSNKTIIPELDGDGWNKAVVERDSVITAFGGLFEAFMSLTYLEALNKLYPGKKLIYNLNEQFKTLVNFNGLADQKEYISKQLIDKYPIPLFFDKENNTYFNSLYNYINEYSYDGSFLYRSYAPLAKQIFGNFCLNWDINYSPQLRNLIDPKEISQWRDTRKFNIDKPYVLIFPDKTDLSIHTYSMLDWTIPQIKSFVSMVCGLGYNSVIVTKNVGKYTGMNALVIPPKIDQIFCLIEKCSVILSDEIDFLLISLLWSKNSFIIGRQNKKEYSLKSNQKFLRTDKKIFEAKVLTPIDVFKAIK